MRLRKIEQPARAVDHQVPLKCRSRIHLVGLYMVMAENPVVIPERFVIQLVGNQFPVRIPRIIALDPGKYLTEGGGQLDQSRVLLRREIILDQLLPLDAPWHRLRSGRMADKTLSQNRGRAEPLWKGQNC